MSVTIADFDALETHGTTLGGETDLILTDDIVIERRVNIAADKVIHFGAFKFIKSWSGEGTNGDEYGLTRISPPSAEDPFKGATGHAMLTVTTGGESKRPVHGTTVEVMGTGTYDGTFEVLASRQLPAPDTAKSEIVIALSFPGAPIDYNSPTTIKIRAVSIQFDGLGLVYIGRQTSNRLNFR